MHGLKVFKIVFVFASLLFIAKPFFGFGISANQHIKINSSHNILVKSFSKRRPESLEDADANARQIHHLLSNPLLVLVSSLSILLFSLFPAALSYCQKLTSRMLSDLLLSLLPPENTYLLVGKLII